MIAHNQISSSRQALKSVCKITKCLDLLILYVRTVHLENAATQTFDLFTSKPHRNHAPCIPEPKQLLSKIEIECLSAQFCMGKLLHLPMDWIL